MTDLIVFSVGSNRYALNIDNIQRIIQAIELTEIPNSHKYVDGMMSHEDSVIKVLNFRKVIGLKTYEEELKELFSKLKSAHQDWRDELRDSIDNGSSFTKTVDPHKCELGMWLDSFNSYDERVSAIFKDLIKHHKHLHVAGGDALEIYKTDKAAAAEMVKTDIYDTFNRTMGDIESFINELDKVANSLQKLLIYEKDGKIFAIKVDIIEDITHVEDTQIMSSGEECQTNEFLELEGILDLNGVLINVVKTINLPS